MSPATLIKLWKWRSFLPDVISCYGSPGKPCPPQKDSTSLNRNKLPHDIPVIQFSQALMSNYANIHELQKDFAFWGVTHQTSIWFFFNQCNCHLSTTLFLPFPSSFPSPHNPGSLTSWNLPEASQCFPWNPSEAYQGFPKASRKIKGIEVLNEKCDLMWVTLKQEWDSLRLYSAWSIRCLTHCYWEEVMSFLSEFLIKHKESWVV